MFFLFNNEYYIICNEQTKELYLGHSPIGLLIAHNQCEQGLPLLHFNFNQEPQPWFSYFYYFDITTTFFLS